MADHDAFIAQYQPVAEKVGAALGVAPESVLAQWGLETGWGKSVIPGTNNLGNIKDTSGGGVAAIDNQTGSVDKYRKYDSPEAFGLDYVGLIGGNKRYAAALNTGDDTTAFANGLKNGGYAEDPDYVRKLSATADVVRQSGGLGDRLAAAVLPSADAAPAPTRNVFDQFDAPTPAPAQAAPLPPEGMDSSGAYHVNISGQGPTPPPAAATPTANVFDQFDNAPAAPAPEAPSFLDQVGRQVGLTARAGVQGLAALPEAVTNAAIGGTNALFGTHIPKADVGATLSAAGLPTPGNATERVAGDVAGALAGTGATMGLGNALSKYAAPVARGIGDMLSSAPLTQTGLAASGTAAGSITRENGGTPGQQLVANLSGSLVPAAMTQAGGALVRGALRGGEAGRQTMLDNIASFNAAGTTPTIGQATQSRLAQGLESTLAQTPGATGIMNRAAQTQTGEIADSVKGIADRLSPNAGTIEAGESVSKGLEGFKAGVKDIQNRLYSTLDQYIPKDTPIAVDRTKDALASLNSGIDGAAATSTMFKNAKIQGIENALKSDLSSGMSAYGAGPSVKSSTLPYESIKKLRTLVGNEIDNTNFTSDVPRDKWKALYGALSSDLGDAATKAGPEAKGAWQWANQFTKTQMGRMEDLSAVAGGDTPEKVFQAALSGSTDGDTRLARVVSAIPKENRKDLAAAVIQRMGRAMAGNQDETGAAFSTNTFLTNWAKMSPAARETLFGRTGDAQLLDQLTNLAGVSSNIRSGSKYLANPSGSGAALARNALGSGIAASLVTGNGPAAAGLIAAPIVGNIAARFMTSPNRLSQIASKSALSSGAGPAATNALAAYLHPHQKARAIP